ncbi:MAG TPA: zf-HC2 domain-containing protein [Cellulomonas sp.]
MTHLGPWLSALADGQLPADETERALAHVATCPRCAAELAAARDAHRTLSAAAAAERLEPAPDLTARLLSLAPAGAPVLGPHPDPFVPTTPLPGRSSGILPGRSSGVLRGDVLGGGRAASRVLVSSVAGIGLVAASLFSLGARPAVIPSTHPGTALGVLGEASVSAPADTTDVSRLASAGWTVPDLPSGWQVAATRAQSGGVEVDLTGPSSTAVVSERRGRLDVAALAGQPTQRVGSRDVYLLSAEPWHVAWQADDTVVEVLAPTAGSDVDALVAAFPAGPFDDGVPARIGRGWSVVARAFETP